MTRRLEVRHILISHFEAGSIIQGVFPSEKRCFQQQSQFDLVREERYSVIENEEIEPFSIAHPREQVVCSDLGNW